MFDYREAPRLGTVIPGPKLSYMKVSINPSRWLVIGQGRTINSIQLIKELEEA